MSDSIAAPTLDQLLRHMGFANARLFALLIPLPPATLQLTARDGSSSIATLAHHFVDAADDYARRLEGLAPPSPSTPPTTRDELVALAELCAAADARILHGALAPDALVSFDFSGTTLQALRSTNIAQAIHHATEHRTQIAGVLDLHGIDVVNLDHLTLWGLPKASS
jgi:uncharacterized damage-inducible protein DinB